MPSPELEPTIRHPAPEIGPRAQRAIERILDATREVFLARGYGGASIDRIAEAAGVSRAAFYTYFPSKRDALLALGEGMTRHSRALIRQLRQLGTGWTTDDLRKWAVMWFAYLDEYGSFGQAWTHAAHEDEELRQAGMKSHLATCRRLGEAMDELRGRGDGDPTLQGLLVSSMFDRVWSHCRLYEPVVTTDDAAGEIATFLTAVLRR
jgi:AcrR family transcriptional regulator